MSYLAAHTFTENVNQGTKLYIKKHTKFMCILNCNKMEWRSNSYSLFTTCISLCCVLYLSLNSYTSQLLFSDLSPHCMTPAKLNIFRTLHLLIPQPGMFFQINVQLLSLLHSHTWLLHLFKAPFTAVFYPQNTHCPFTPHIFLHAISDYQIFFAPFSEKRT